MKFKDKKYIGFENSDNEQIYQVNEIDLFTLGFPDVYDDITANFTINPKDNSLTIELDEFTRQEYPKKAYDGLIKDIKKVIQEFPYIDEYKLVFE